MRPRMSMRDCVPQSVGASVTLSCKCLRKDNAYRPAEVFGVVGGEIGNFLP